MRFLAPGLLAGAQGEAIANGEADTDSDSSSNSSSNSSSGDSDDKTLLSLVPAHLRPAAKVATAKPKGRPRLLHQASRQTRLDGKRMAEVFAKLTKDPEVKLEEIDALVSAIVAPDGPKAKDSPSAAHGAGRFIMIYRCPSVVETLVRPPEN